MKRVTTRMAGMFLLVLCLLLPPRLATQSAAALTPSPYPVALYAHQALSHPDGAMTFMECMPPASQAYSTQRIITVDTVGNQLASIPKPSASYGVWETYSYEDNVLAGYDSTVYVVESKGDRYGNMEYRIAAYKFGIQLWTYSLPTCSRYELSARPKWLTLGYDGNLYAIMSSRECSLSDRLVGLNASDGSSRFTPKPLTEDITNVIAWAPRLGVYAGGMVVLDSDTLQYYDYSGQANHTSYSLPLETSEFFDHLVFDASGKVTIPLRKSGSTCIGINRIITRTHWREHELLNNGGMPFCQRAPFHP